MSVVDPNGKAITPIPGYRARGPDEKIQATDLGWSLGTTVGSQDVCRQQFNQMQAELNTPLGPSSGTGVPGWYFDAEDVTKTVAAFERDRGLTLVFCREAAHAPSSPPLGLTFELRFGALAFNVTVVQRDTRWVVFAWTADDPTYVVHDKIVGALGCEGFALPITDAPTLTADVFRRALLHFAGVESDRTDDWEWKFQRKMSPGWVAADSQRYVKTAYGPGTHAEHDDNL